MKTKPQGFSLVEVMVGAGILLISAMAVAYLMKGTHTPQLDSLKACQDINEEILAGINSLGQGGFAYTYGTGTGDSRNCPGGVCREGELKLPSNIRWAPTITDLTSVRNVGDPVPPTVRPHYLKLNSMNYLSALYNSGGFCSEAGGVIPGANSGFDIFGSSKGNNILQDRGRGGKTSNSRLRIQVLDASGTPFCPPGRIHIRPPAAGKGYSSVVLEQGVVNQAQAARSDRGFRVQVITKYVDKRGDNTEKTCVAEKNFHYQPESLRGAISVNPPTPLFPVPASPADLPVCTDPNPIVVGFTTRFTKVKKDSVLLCRDRSVVGTWDMSCDPADPTVVCGCDVADGCYNGWATFPPPPSPISFVNPNSNWFPCDLLPSYLVAANIVEQASDVQVSFEGTGTGVFAFTVTDLKTEAPTRLPKKLLVDIIEVDSALNSTADVVGTPPGSEFNLLEANFFGKIPGTNVCDDCAGGFKHVCGDCEACCDSAAACCDGDVYPTNPNCTCDNTTTCCPGDTFATNPANCDDCNPCTLWTTGGGVDCNGDACTTDVCGAWRDGPIGNYCQADSQRHNQCQFEPATCCDPSTQCCPGDTFPGNPNCNCDSTTTCCPGDTNATNPICPPPCVDACHPGGSMTCEEFLGFPGAGQTGDASCTAPFIRCTCP